MGHDAGDTAEHRAGLQACRVLLVALFVFAIALPLAANLAGLDDSHKWLKRAVFQSFPAARYRQPFGDDRFR